MAPGVFPVQLIKQKMMRCGTIDGTVEAQICPQEFETQVKVGGMEPQVQAENDGAKVGVDTPIQEEARHIFSSRYVLRNMTTSRALNTDDVGRS